VVQINKDILKINSTLQLLVYADDDVNIMCGRVNTIKENKIFSS
jgi:hypothetical protein